MRTPDGRSRSPDQRPRTGPRRNRAISLSRLYRQCSAAGTPSLLHTVTAPVTGPASARSRAAAPCASADGCPGGAEVEYAYRAGYDSRGQVSVAHLVDERGHSVILTKPEPSGPGPGEDRTGV